MKAIIVKDVSAMPRNKKRWMATYMEHKPYGPKAFAAGLPQADAAAYTARGARCQQDVAALAFADAEGIYGALVSGMGASSTRVYVQTRVDLASGTCVIEYP